MITPDMIPDEVVEAAAWAMCDDINGEGAWDETPFRHRPMWRSAARASIIAVINAWPGVCSARDDFIAMADEGPWLILPLPQEASDD